FHPIGNDDLGGADFRFAGGVLQQADDFSCRIGAAADLQRHAVFAANFGLDVHHPAELVEVDGVELAGAAGRVDAVRAGLAYPLDVGAVARLVEAVLFVPTYRQGGPNPATGFERETTHLHSPRLLVPTLHVGTHCLAALRRVRSRRGTLSVPS